MRILIPGGSGQVGTLLARHLYAAGHEVTVLSRHPSEHAEQSWRMLAWDGVTVGPWAAEIDRSDAVIHLSGRSVNCRYNAKNRQEIFDSRVKPYAATWSGDCSVAYASCYLDEREYEHVLPTRAGPRAG
jgi:NAD dependent epimerase/dehydratase family enzyme